MTNITTTFFWMPAVTDAAVSAAGGWTTDWASSADPAAAGPETAEPAFLEWAAAEAILRGQNHSAPFSLMGQTGEGHSIIRSARRFAPHLRAASAGASGSGSAEVRRAIASLIPSSRRRYQNHLNQIEQGNYGPKIFETILLVLRSDQEEGLDLIDVLADLTITRRWENAPALAEVLYAAAGQDPAVILPMVHVTERVLQTSAEDVQSLAAARAVLAAHFPAITRAVWLNLESQALPPIDVRNFLYALPHLVPPHPEQTPSVLEAIRPILTDTLGTPWTGRAAAIRAKAGKARLGIELLRKFRAMPGHAAEVAKLISVIWADEHPKDIFYAYETFVSLYQKIGLPRERALADWLTLTREGDAMEKWGDFFQCLKDLTAFLPGRPALFAATHPKTLQAIAERKVQSDHWLRELSDISHAPATWRLFQAFAEKIHGDPRLNSPLIYIHLFSNLAVEELLLDTDVATATPSWSGESFKETTPDEIEALQEVFRELQAGMADLAQRDTSVDFGGLLRKELPDEEKTPEEKILDQHRTIINTGAAGPLDLEGKVQEFLQSLAGLPMRGIVRRFTRTDMALNLLHLDSLGRFCPDIMPLLALDLTELKGDIGQDRGAIFSIWIGRLLLLQHPQTVPAVEAILQAALTPPPPRLVPISHASPEEVVVVTAGEMLNDYLLGRLEKLPLSREGKILLERAAVIFGQYRKKEKARGRGYHGDVEELFYGGPSPGERDEMTGDQLVLPEAAQPLLPEGAATDSAGEATSMALSRILTGQALAARQIAPNPRTGLMEIRLEGGRSIPVWHAVAPLWGETARGHQTDWHRRQAPSHSEVVQALRALDEEQGGLDLQPLIPKPSGDALAIKGRLAAAKEADSIRMMMESRWGENPMGKLMAKISAFVSIKLGLQMIETALQVVRKDPNISIQTLADLNRYLPNVTALEVALVSLTERVPRLLLEERGLTLPFLFKVLGIEWANDTYDPQTMRQGLFPIDPYNDLGITGHSLHTEFIHFSPGVIQQIQGALKAKLTDRILFDQLWQAYPEAAGIGLNTFKETGDPRTLLNKEIIDVDFERSLRPSEAVRLAGLLQEIPACLNAAEPARIYFKPFAAGVIFLDARGRPLEFVPYHPYLARTGFQEIHYKTAADLTDENPLAHQFLTQELIGVLYGAAMAQEEGGISRVEEAALRFSGRFQIQLPLTTSPLEARDKVMKITVTVRSLKMGLDEIEGLTEVFSTLPPSVLQRARDGSEHGGGIRVIHKLLSEAVDFVDLTRHGNRLGEYNPNDKTITIYHVQQIPYHQLDSAGRQIWSDTVLHEIGESLFASLSAEEKEDFISIYPWRSADLLLDEGVQIPAALIAQMERWEQEDLHLTPAFPDAEFSRHLLTSYAGSNPGDFFCEAFMAYIAHGPEFRAKAAESPYLKKAYDWLKTHIFTTPKAAYEFDRPATVTLAEIEGEIRRWQMEFHKKDEELRLEELHEAAKNEIFPRYVESVEAGREKIIAEEEGAAQEEGWGNGHFAEAFFELAGLDDRGRQLRTAIGPSAGEGVTASELDLHEAMKKFLEEDVFYNLFLEKKTAVDQSEEDFSFKQDLDSLLWEVWELMQQGDRRGAVERIQQFLDQFQDQWEATEEDIPEAEDLLTALAEVVACRFSAEGWFSARAVKILTPFVLPGQYQREDLTALEAIWRLRLSDVEVIRKFYEYVLAKNGSWNLSAADQAELAGDLAGLTSVGKELGERGIITLIAHLTEGKTDIYETAKAARLKPGQVDAFARKFLPPAEYKKLTARSEQEALRHNLKLAASIHLNVARQFRERYGEEAELPEVLIQGLGRIEEALSILERGESGALAKAKAVLADHQHAQAINDMVRDLFRDKK